jgi:signal transduction histidine kinase
LHDDVLQQAMLLTRQVADLGDSPQVAKVLSQARSIAGSLRATCLELRPPLLDEPGLPEALSFLAQQTQQQSGMRVLFQTRMPAGGPGLRPSDEVELMLYRVCQEALTNVVKHAEASLVWIRLRISAQGTIALLIVDNGHGLQRRRPGTGSLGLTGMAERMEAIGGSWALRSSPGRGVAVGARYCPGVGETKDAARHREVDRYSG